MPRGRRLEVGLAALTRATVDHRRGGVRCGWSEFARPRLAGERLAGSYVNFFIANSAVVYPLLDERHDEEVRVLLGDEFPDRRIVGRAGP